MTSFRIPGASDPESVRNPQGSRGAPATASIAEAAAYMKLGDIKGEAADRGHKEWIELHSVSSSPLALVADAAGACPSAPTGSGHVTVLKAYDSSTTPVQTAMCGATVFPDVEIHIHGAKPGEPSATYKLKDVLISSYSLGTTPDKKGNALPTEEITLDYGSIEIAHSPTGSDQ